jgi:hypothetical protein
VRMSVAWQRTGGEGWVPSGAGSAPRGWHRYRPRSRGPWSRRPGADSIPTNEASDPPSGLVGIILQRGMRGCPGPQDSAPLASRLPRGPTEDLLQGFQRSLPLQDQGPRVPDRPQSGVHGRDDLEPNPGGAPVLTGQGHCHFHQVLGAPWKNSRRSRERVRGNEVDAPGANRTSLSIRPLIVSRSRRKRVQSRATRRASGLSSGFDPSDPGSWPKAPFPGRGRSRS